MSRHAPGMPRRLATARKLSPQMSGPPSTTKRTTRRHRNHRCIAEEQPKHQTKRRGGLADGTVESGGRSSSGKPSPASEQLRYNAQKDLGVRDRLYEKTLVRGSSDRSRQLGNIVHLGVVASICSDENASRCSGRCKAERNEVRFVAPIGQPRWLGCHTDPPSSTRPCCQLALCCKRFGSVSCAPAVEPIWKDVHPDPILHDDSDGQPDGTRKRWLLSLGNTVGEH